MPSRADTVTASAVGRIDRFMVQGAQTLDVLEKVMARLT
jgi:hypothetical protein